MREELALHADVETDLTDREGAAGACAMALEDHALEDLDAILVAFDDFVVNSNGVSDAEVGDTRSELLVLDGVDLRVLHDGSEIVACLIRACESWEA